MIRTIIKREFLDNFLSFKFIACVVVAIVLTFVSTALLTNDYRASLKDYEAGIALSNDSLKRVPVYSYLTFKVFKKPNPLSIFVSGVERETGNYVNLSHRDIPASLKGGRITNEFSHILSFFDLSSIITVLFSILAILLSYNAFSGEREDGTLSLVLANSIPRYELLLGKYLGMLIALVAPIILSFAVGLLIVFVAGIPLTGTFAATVFILCVSSIIYLSTVLLIGVLASSRTKKPFMSLLVLLAFYIASIIILPTAIKNYAENTIGLNARNYEKNVQGLLDARTDELDQKTGELRPPRTWSFRETTSEGGILLKRINPPVLIEFLKKLFPITQKTIENYAVRINSLREEDERITARTRRWQNLLLLLVPPSNFSRSAELIADTGEDHLTRFFSELALYWHAYVRYLDEKDAFGLRYFYPYQEEFNQTEKELIANINKDYKGGPFRPYTGKYALEARSYNPGFRDLDLNDMPRFSFEETSVEEKIVQALPGLLILLLYNLLFLFLSHLSLNAYDPRRA
jgi:ABC-type transport system involved in multi-copper enzyme maturation permease subunit